MRCRTAFGWMMSLTLVSSVVAQPVEFEAMGYYDLVSRLGGDFPTGAGIVVAEVESPDAGQYGPDPDDPQFVGKTFTPMSGFPGSTGHATAVGRRQFGLNWSMARDVDDIFLYEASGWAGSDYLRTSVTDPSAPVATPGGIRSFNCSWIGSYGSVDMDNNCLRRTDLVVTRDQLIITTGINNNGGDNLPLLSHAYNAIAVGIADGTHTATDTVGPYDGPGRMKPEIVGFADYTSYAAPQVNAGASLLQETAATWPTLSSNPNAARADVIKAVLLAGATHEEMNGTWSNEPETSGPDRGVTSRPIDPVVGAGSLNINFSHMIHTGGEHAGSELPASAPSVPWAGWDLATVGLDESRYWKIVVPRLADEVSILATWNRKIRLQNSTWTVADFDLILWRLEGGELVSLVGDDGLPYFGGGNVVSESGVDNVEHLYITDLAPGTYVLELVRLDNVVSSSNWDAAVAWLRPEVTTAPEDINGDGIVGFLDLLAVLSAWGDCTGCPEDIDGDGIVGFLDLLAVLSEWS